MIRPHQFSKRALVAFILSGSCAAYSIQAVFAQGFPVKAVRLIVPYAPGGGVDIMARIIAPRLGEGLGQQIVVDNRPGGGTIIGTDLVARAAPDGYTLLMANPAHAANPALRVKLPYDSLKDFAPVGLVALSSSVLVVHPSLPVRTAGDLVRLAKSKPGQLNYASGGTGSAIYLAMESFKSTTGIDVVHVPYKGAAPALTDVIGGQVPMMFTTTPASLAHIKSGRLRALGASSGKRLPLLPDVPTIAESGYPGFELNDWYGVLAPAATPRTIIDRLNAAINKALTAADVRERISGLGAEPASSTPDQFGERLTHEVARWAKVIKTPVANLD